MNITAITVVWAAISAAIGVSTPIAAPDNAATHDFGGMVKLTNGWGSDAGQEEPAASGGEGNFESLGTEKADENICGSGCSRSPLPPSWPDTPYSATSNSNYGTNAQEFSHFGPTSGPEQPTDTESGNE